MSFITKFNLSGNRFMKQDINSVTNFDGINHFSVPLENRLLGPDLEKISKNVIESKITSSFTFDKNAKTFTFSNKLINSMSVYINSEVTPYDDTINVYTPFTGFESYKIKNVEFFSFYKNYECDINFEIIDENDQYIIGNSFTDNYFECIAESLDYSGNDIVVNVNGGIACDFMNSKTNYMITNINDDITLSLDSNIFYIYQKGVITINSNTLIGWNAFIYTNNPIVFETENIIYVDDSENKKLKEIIKIEENKYIIK